MDGDLLGRRFPPVRLGPGIRPAAGTGTELCTYLLCFVHDLSKGGSCFFMNNLYMIFPRHPHPAPPQRGRSPWRPPHHGPRCFSAGCGSSLWQHECMRRALSLSLISGASFVLRKTLRRPVSLCSRLLGSSSPRRAPQTVCESPRRAEVGCRGSHSFGKAVGQAATTTRSAGEASPQAGQGH